MGTFGELLNLDLKSQPYDTIGGLVYCLLGAAPQEVATTTVGQMQATVVEMDGRRVRRVRIERRTRCRHSRGTRGLRDRQRNGRQHREPIDALRRYRTAAHLWPRP